MILQTGGFAFGEISTKSKSASLAKASAFDKLSTSAPSSDTTRTSCARIFSFTL